MSILVAHNFYQPPGGEDQCAAADLAAKARRILADPQTLTRMRRAARGDVDRYFTVDANHRGLKAFAELPAHCPLSGMSMGTRDADVLAVPLCASGVSECARSRDGCGGATPTSFRDSRFLPLLNSSAGAATAGREKRWIARISIIRRPSRRLGTK